ncbi:hypothetical protein F2Q70_00006487 [Brassica cretica]|uniref:Uncharacterized protein n=1 Tax=Brassica cretica TaxID=69181 RepID=A0A8S9J3N4_BRACR|nr:hypothetical protein F2Q70_00006487 [Brassica cretica]
MMHIYTTCGVWEFGATTGWVFSADEKGARLLLLESSSTLEVFKRMVLEDFDMEEDSLPDLESSYLPTELINTSTCPPVIIANDRQLQNFVGFVQKGNEPAPVFAERQSEKKKEKIRGVEVDEDAYDADTMISAKEDIHNMSEFSLLNVVKKGQLVENKTLLKVTFEICAMKHNFHYEDSAYFIIKKYVGEHTCAPSSKTKAGKTASAKTIGSLIMHRSSNNGDLSNRVRSIVLKNLGIKPPSIHICSLTPDVTSCIHSSALSDVLTSPIQIKHDDDTHPYLKAVFCSYKRGKPCSLEHHHSPFVLASVPPPLRCDCSDSGKEKRETVTLMPATVPSRHLQTPAQGGFKNDYMKHLKQASKRSSFKHGRCVTVHGGFKKHIQNYKMIVEGLSANMSSQFYVILEVFKVSPTFIMLYKTLCIKLDDIIWKPPDASARNRATKSKSKRR